MGNFNKNKKAFLLAEETLKIIIAVICILFLAYILIAIYNSQTANKKIEEAKSSLERVGEIASSLKEGEIESQDISNPKGWHIYSFVGQKKPNSCLNQNCLCICSDALVEKINSQEKKCDKYGSCLIIENLATANLDLKIRDTSNLLFIGIRRQGDKILVGRV